MEPKVKALVSSTSFGNERKVCHLRTDTVENLSVFLGENEPVANDPFLNIYPVFCVLDGGTFYPELKDVKVSVGSKLLSGFRVGSIKQFSPAAIILHELTKNNADYTNDLKILFDLPSFSPIELIDHLHEEYIGKRATWVCLTEEDAFAYGQCVEKVEFKEGRVIARDCRGGYLVTL